MKIKLIKFKDDLIEPIRAHYDDAGIDCFAQEDIKLEGPYTSVFGSVQLKTELVDLGFGLEVPNGYMATIRPRSSMNCKGIITQISTIDSGYRGQIKAAFINLNSSTYHIKKGDKICQIIVEPVVLADLVENLGEERGQNGFGSTGR